VKKTRCYKSAQQTFADQFSFFAVKPQRMNENINENFQMNENLK
jgi:hypothetical protein